MAQFLVGASTGISLMILVMNLMPAIIIEYDEMADLINDAYEVCDENHFEELEFWIGDHYRVTCAYNQTYTLND